MRRIQLPAVFLAVTMIAACAPAESPVLDTLGPGWTGATEPEELIEARRLLMLDIERQMAPLDEFILGGPGDLPELKARATSIEAMLLAFAHLFPPTTNLFDPTVLESPTIALPDIWEDFDAFLSLIDAGESAAAAVIAAEDAERLRAAAASLRATCETCHARFTRPYTPPVVTQEDLEFDFERYLP